MKIRGTLGAVGVVFCVAGTGLFAGGCGPDDSLFTGAGANGGDGGAGAAGQGGAGASTSAGGNGGSGASTSAGGQGGEGGSGASGGGTTTTASPCAPGEEMPCYEGPAGTKGVGQCKEGKAQCLPDGSGFGQCTGQVLPAVEDCAQPVDENCDGEAPPCTGDVLWAKRFGSAGAEVGSFLPALAGSGDVILTAGVKDPVDFGGGALAGTVVDAVVVKLNSTGAHVWSKALGGSQFDIGEAVAADPSGAVLLAGSFFGSADFGGGVVQSAGADDIFLVKLGADGDHVWDRRFGDAGTQNVHSLAVTPQGDIVLCGVFTSSIDLGGGAFTSAGKLDVFVAKLDAAGDHVWSRHFSNTESASCRGLEVDPDGNVLVAGSHDSDLDAGGSVLSVSGGPLSNNVYVVKLTSAGDHVWSQSFGDILNQAARGLAVDPAGNVLVTGQNSGTVNFGGNPLITGGGGDVFVAKLSPAGEHLWSKQFGGPSDQAGNEIAADAAGNIVVAGTFSGTVGFGGAPLVSQSGTHVFVAKLDGKGDHVWSKATSGTMSESSDGLAVAPEGTVFLAGEMGGTVDFGGISLMSAGLGDFFVARLAP